MKDRLGRLQIDDDRIGDVRGRGAMIAMELVKPGSFEPDADLTKALCAGCHEAGVILLSCGTFGNVIRFLPPLTISDDLLVEGLDVLTLVLKDALTTERFTWPAILEFRISSAASSPTP